MPIASLCGCAGLVSQAQAATLVQRPARPAPELVLSDLEGRPVDLGQRGRGKAALLYFWTRGCRPCIDDLPALHRLRQDLQARGLEVIAVAVGGREEALAASGRLGISLSVVVDAHGTAMHRFRISGLPTTVLLDGAGLIRAEAIGRVDWAAPAVRAHLEALLSEP